VKSVLFGIVVAVAVSFASQWYVLSHAGDTTLKEIQFADSLRGWAAANRCLFETTDRGRTWSVERSIADTEFGGLAVIDSGHVFVSYWIMYYDHYTWYYVWIDERFQGSWQNRYFEHRGNGYFALQACRFSVLDSLHLWHLGWWSPYASVAVRTTDGGDTWLPGSMFTKAYYDASFTDTLTGWAAWDVIGKTTNAGDSWYVLTSDVGARRIQMFDSLSGWVMTTSGLLHTMDGGVSWDTVVAESGPKAMRFCNPRHGVAVGLGGAILHTTDAGATWQHDTTESSLDLYAVWMVDSAHAWAAGDSGVVLGMGDWAIPGIEEPQRLSCRFQLARAWPNRCRGTLWAQCRGGTGSVVVYDGCGRPVRGVECSSAKVQKIDLRGLPVGVYFVRVPSSPSAGVRFVLLR